MVWINKMYEGVNHRRVRRWWCETYTYDGMRRVRWCETVCYESVHVNDGVNRMKVWIVHLYDGVNHTRVWWCETYTYDTRVRCCGSYTCMMVWNNKLYGVNRTLVWRPVWIIHVYDDVQRTRTTHVIHTERANLTRTMLWIIHVYDVMESVQCIRVSIKHVYDSVKTWTNTTRRRGKRRMASWLILHGKWELTYWKS